MQLVPFKFVGDILRRAHIVPSQPRTYTGIFNPAFFQFLFNVIMTVPFGIYLRYYFKCRFLKTLILSFCLSLFFELTQLSGLYFIYPRSYRLFDVDDLLANTLGCFWLRYHFTIFKNTALPGADRQSQLPPGPAGFPDPAPDFRHV